MISGQYTLDDDPVEGATVRVIDETTTPATHLAMTQTDADGDWSVDITVDEGDSVLCIIEYVDGEGEYHFAEARPFVAG